MSLRILHILDHSIPLHSGYTFRTLSILKQQRALGWETFHMTTPKQPSGDMLEEDVEGWHFFRTPAARPSPIRIPGMGEIILMRVVEKRLDEIVRQVKPDILHPHSPVLNGIPALRVGKRHGIPVVYEMRGLWEDAAVDHGTTTEGSLRYRLSRALETYALRRADHVTTICDGLRRDILSRGGIASDKITIIPNAVDIGHFSMGGEPDEALKAKLGLAGCVVIGFVGSFYAYEGLDLLVESLPRVLSRVPEARVLLVGGGPQDQAIREQVKRMGLEDKVVMTGRVPHQDVKQYYDIIDVLAYPRHPMRLTDLVTPLKPLEAMAQGRVLVASDVGGHKELIQDGRTGSLFRAGNADSLADAIVQLLNKRDHWGEIRRAGRAFVENERSWAKSVGAYKGVYERVLRLKGGRA